MHYEKEVFGIIDGRFDGSIYGRLFDTRKQCGERQRDRRRGEEGAQKVFRYSVTSDVSTLDPQKNNDSTSGTIGYHTGEGLTRSMDGVVHPGLAEEWEVSDDGLTYTFHLRDAKYSDGEKIRRKF